MQMPEEPKESAPIRAALAASDWRVAPGESTTIRLTIENRGELPDAVSIQVSGIPAGWFEPIPPVALAAGAREAVMLTVSAPDQSEGAVGIHNFKLQLQGENHPESPVSLQGALAVAALESKGRIRVLMENVRYSVTPGSPCRIRFLLVNQGQETDTIRFGIRGIPAGWASAPNPELALEPGAQGRMTVDIEPPRSPESRAGRHEFILQINSDLDPEPVSEIEITLTVNAFADFELSASPSNITAGDSIDLRIKNRGNIPDVYALTTRESSGDVRIETLPIDSGDMVEVVDLDSDAAGSGRWGIRIPAGGTAVVSMLPRLRMPAFLYGNREWRLEIDVTGVSGGVRNTVITIRNRSSLPAWMVPTGIVTILAGLCLVSFGLISRPISGGAAATGTALALQAPSQTVAALQTLSVETTQTAAIAMTQTAGFGQGDEDADGLSLDQELAFGTDPNNPDTDGDGLLDGDEIIRTTNPTNPDTDGDGLSDGQEVALNLDPLNPDTDGDGLSDGQEIAQGTAPDRPDTDNDGLLDGQESPPCPDPLNPDTDGDGLVDAQDLNPCDAANPALTATAGAVPTLTPTPSPGPGPSATPTTPVGNDFGQFLIVSNRDGNPEIYLFDSADSSLLRLTDNGAADTQPVLSPDGTRIAFVSDRDGNAEIYVMNADGSNQVNLSNDPGADRDPTWSPDGTKLAFASNRTGNDEIFIIDADGTDPINFSNNPANETQPVWYRSGPGDFAWSIVFTTDRDGDLEIYSVPTDGGPQVNLTNSPGPDYSPAPLPGNNLLAFVSERDGNPEIYVTSLIPSAVQSNLSDHPAVDRDPAWTSGGEWVVFVSDRDGNLEIYAIEVSETRLTSNLTGASGSNEYDPAWVGP